MMETINICPADNESKEQWLQSATLSLWYLTHASAIPALVWGQSVPIKQQQRNFFTLSGCIHQQSKLGAKHENTANTQPWMPMWSGCFLHFTSNEIILGNAGVICVFYTICNISWLHFHKPNTAASSSKHTDFRGSGSNGGVATPCGLVYGWLSVRSSGVAIFVWLSTSSGEIGVDRTSSARGHYNITSALLTFQFWTHSLSPSPEWRGGGEGINSPYSVKIKDLETGLRGGGRGEWHIATLPGFSPLGKMTSSPGRNHNPRTNTATSGHDIFCPEAQAYF